MQSNGKQENLSRRDFWHVSAAATTGLLLGACIAPSAPGSVLKADADLVKVLDNWGVVRSSHDADKVLALFTEDCVYEDVPSAVVNHGKQQLKAFANDFFRQFPDVDVKVNTRFVAVPFGSAEWLMTGTDKGGAPGYPASNKRMSVRGASVFELQGDKIKRCSDYWDVATYLQQLGFMPKA